MEKVYDGCWDDEVKIVEVRCCNGKKEGGNVKGQSGVKEKIVKTEKVVEKVI